MSEVKRFSTPWLEKRDFFGEDWWCVKDSEGFKRPVCCDTFLAIHRSDNAHTLRLHFSTEVFRGGMPGEFNRGRERSGEGSLEVSQPLKELGKEHGIEYKTPIWWGIEEQT